MRYRQMLCLSHICSVLTLGIATVVSAEAQAQTSLCGNIANAYGPFDYRTDRDKLPIVDNHHFTPEVEALIRGHGGYLGGDLDYTLRAFPNHHRALIAVMRYGQRTKLPVPPNMNYSVECYFARALQFRPDDTTVRMLYAGFLYQNSRREEAAKQLERAAFDGNDNGFTQYNIGLVHLEAQQYEKALAQAHRALALGFTRPDLKAQLVALGRWREPEAVTPQEGTSSRPVPSTVGAPGSASSGR